MALRIERSNRPPTPPRPNVHRIATDRIRRQCWRGELPAEVLALIDPREVDQLVFDLWSDGWTDVEIATHTRLSTYTTGRIRARLGLAAHPPAREVPA